MHEASTRNVLPIPILTYHQIAPKPPKGTPFRSLCVAPNSFARQMGLLRLLGYQGLSMTGLLPYLRGERQGKVVGITFDDGYQNNLVYALPVLRRYGFSSTCYVVSELLGQTNAWDRETGIVQVPLMTQGELLQWVGAGQEVGAHTRHHVHLPQLDEAACEAQIAGCKTDLEHLLQREVAHFCYPYGDYAPHHVQMVRDAGYATATTTQRGRCQNNEGMLQLPRVAMPRTLTHMVMWLKIATRYEDRRRA